MDHKHQEQPDVRRLQYLQTEQGSVAPENLSVDADLSVESSTAVRVSLARYGQKVPSTSPSTKLLTESAHRSDIQPEQEVVSKSTCCAEAESRGYQAGRAAMAESYQTTEKRNADCVASAIRELERFQKEQLARMQPEIIATSLQLAEKILCRQIEVDSLFLASSVRHALDLNRTSVTLVLKVAAVDHLAWLGLFGHSGEGYGPVKLSVDLSLQAGMCRVEGNGAYTDYSAKTQFEEMIMKFGKMLTQDDSMSSRATAR
jgi:flagellar biosynthesis/type III secretory pathway protein FliH